MGKDSFLIYTSFYKPISILSDKQIGRLFRAIFKYNLGEAVDVEDDIRMAFEFFKNQFEIDERKYQTKVMKNNESGRKGGNPNFKKGKSNPYYAKDNAKITGDNQGLCEITEDNPNITGDNQTLPKITEDNPINDNDNDNDIKEISLSRDKEIPQLEKDIKMPLDECHSYILKNYSQWVETVTMNIRSSGFPDFTMDSFKDYLRRFFEKLKNEGEDGKSPSDAQSHFYRWLVIQLGNAPKNAYLAENNRLLEWLPDGMYKRFVGMVHDFAPYCFANMKMPSEEEVDGFKRMFESTKTIREALMQVENNTELRRKREYLGQTIRDQLAITKKINT